MVGFLGTWMQEAEWTKPRETRYAKRVRLEKSKCNRKKKEKTMAELQQGKKRYEKY